MKTSFNIQKGDFDISWPERISRHDIVFEAPPTDPMQYGLPVGNGEVGALIWCDDRRIFIAVNKSDLWDDAEFGEFCNWEEKEEELNTTLRHACRIIIDFKKPIFDTFYLTDFKARLSIKDGCAKLCLESPFGSLSAKIFIAENMDVLCADFTCDFVEKDEMEITVERYGSRTFAHWYSMVKRDPMIGLGGTGTFVENNKAYISHKLTTGTFYCGAVCNNLLPSRSSSRACVFRGNSEKFTLYLSVTSPFDENGKESLENNLKKASDTGVDKLLEENEASWREFWEKSFIETDDDYLDNYWHVAMYYANAGQRGRYPGRFINSLWNWRADVQPWNFYFHWNQQQAYWGLNAAGHHNLCETYLNYRWNGMEHSAETAKKHFGVENGIFVSDVCDRRGYNSVLELNNHTPVGEVALDFWRQYKYTCDKEFLKEKALPYMLAASHFFATLFEKGGDGKYHAKRGMPYEGEDVLGDVVTELAMARVLFAATLDALKEAGESAPDEEIFRDILENITPFVLVDCDSEIIENGVIKRGMFKGEHVKTNKVIAVGRVLEETGTRLPDERRTAYYEEHLGEYIPQFIPGEEVEIPFKGIDVLRAVARGERVPSQVESGVDQITFAHFQASVAPVYPMELVGVKDRGSELYDALVSTALYSRNEQSMGWDPMPVVLARLGLSDEVDRFIYDYPSYWQGYNNGFSHYDKGYVFNQHMPFRRVDILDLDSETGEKYRGERFPFRHMGLEPLGVFSATMNERLMQSYDGTIRIAPAYGKRSAKFKLHAVGGFEVMCEIFDGVVSFVAIKSLFGNKLTLENPWDTAWCEGEKLEGDISLDTEKGKVYVFTPSPDALFEFEKEVPSQNDSCKVRPDGNAMLGLARSF